MRPSAAAFALVAVLFVNLNLLGEAPKDLYTLTPQEFFGIDAVDAPLEPGKINDRLLAAAVFHQTNRIRVDHELKPLRYHEKLAQAAAIQTESMLKHHYLEHENPHEKGMRWPMDRVLSTGYKPRSVSENVAQVFRVRYEPPKPYYKVEEGGKTVFSYEPDGTPPIPAHTYETFAEFLLKEWMNSPGHRENILRPDSEEFGACVRFDYKKDDLDEAYATQVFAKPLR